MLIYLHAGNRLLGVLGGFLLLGDGLLLLHWHGLVVGLAESDWRIFLVQHKIRLRLSFRLWLFIVDFWLFRN